MDTITVDVRFKVQVSSKDDFMKAIKKSEMMNVAGIELDGFTVKDNSKEYEKPNRKKDD